MLNRHMNLYVSVNMGAARPREPTEKEKTYIYMIRESAFLPGCVLKSSVAIFPMRSHGFLSCSIVFLCFPITLFDAIRCLCDFNMCF